MRLILTVSGEGYITKEMLEFGVACFVIAFLIILVDWILLAILDRSILEISYGSKSRLLILFGWSFASAIVGAFAASLKIVESNLQAAITVAIGWPLILTRLVENNLSTPVQNVSDEEAE